VTDAWMAHVDTDGDGYGDPDVTAATCGEDATLTEDTSDCNDSDGAVHPGSDEVCDGIDNDCDDDIDLDDGSLTDSFVAFVDADDDGYGQTGSDTVVCVLEVGMVTVDGDCDDDDVLINPGSDEICDGIDNDCDDAIDDHDDSVTDLYTWYIDEDEDG